MPFRKYNSNYNSLLLFFLGGICILPKWWTTTKWCSDDHLEPLAYGCYHGYCTLQCERGDEKWCYPVRSVCGKWKYIDCTKHSECAPKPDQKCRKRCSTSRLERFDQFYASALTPTQTAELCTTQPSTTTTTPPTATGF